MTKPRRRFTDEFKREAVALLDASGRPLMQIANELGFSPSMLRNSRNAAGVPAGASSLPKKQAMPPPADMSGDQSAQIAPPPGGRTVAYGTGHSKKTVAIFSEPPR